MRKSAVVLLFVVALLVVPTGPSPAWTGHGGWHGGWNGGWHGGTWGWHGGGWGWYGGGWRGAVVVGGPWWGYPYSYPYAYPYWYYPPPYYPSYPSYPSVTLQGPSVYVQQPPASSAAHPQAYWYYCASAKAYYPKVRKCREAWIKVPPTPE